MKTVWLAFWIRKVSVLGLMLAVATLSGCGSSGGGGSAALTASANTSAQSLLVGTSITSFTPLTASGGATPYVYSYTGTLPVGLNYDASTGVLTGTPTATYATANVTFSVKDANNTVASTISTVSFSVAYPVVTFTNGQAADVVIGQMDFTSNSANQGGTVGANTLNQPFSQAFVNAGMLYLPDTTNNRTLVFNSIPTSNGVDANYALGQIDLTSNAVGNSATAVNQPQQLMISNGALVQTDFGNNRVIIYNPIPATGPGTISVVLGQPDKTSKGSTCTASGLKAPGFVVSANGKLIVSDTSNNRILIWNTIPTSDGTPADLVLGQSDFTSCNANGNSGVADAATLSHPTGLWTDGTRLIVVDSGNKRGLIWNTFPTQNGQTADRVLGQPDFTSITANQGGTATASTLYGGDYDGVFFNGTQLFIGDSNNNRVLVWNSLPTVNGQAADVVLGQPDFTSSSSGTSATQMRSPCGVFLSGKQLIVTDTGNNRSLVFNGQ